VLTRFVRIQLVIFCVVAAVMLSLVVFVYADLPKQLGFGQYPLTVQFERTSGLYPRANVTYRGITIGTVEDLRLGKDGGTEVELSIDDDEQIPADATATIRSLSAVGELFVEFRSDRSRGPYLTPGDVVPSSRTRLPTDIGPLLEDVNALVQSLPKDSLQTVIDEAFLASRDVGPDLRRLIDNTSLLLDEAEATYQPTETLLSDIEPLLDTQLVTSEQIRSLIRDLASVTDQLRASDSDLRALLHQGQPFAEQINGLFQDLRPTVPLLLSNLISTGQVLVTYHPGLEQTLVLLPPVVAAVQTSLLPTREAGTANLDFKVGANVPPPCYIGFLDELRPPHEVEVIETPLDLYCKTPQNDPSVVRGTRNMPCMEDPGERAATPAQCRGEGYRPLRRSEFAPGAVSGQPSVPHVSVPSPPASASPVAVATYSPATGRVMAPDGTFFVLGRTGGPASSEEDQGWQTLLLDPLGR
jgi:phospholipid/cholesterol/gamma-HCH transport system substrate-binding protein